MRAFLALQHCGSWKGLLNLSLVYSLRDTKEFSSSVPTHKKGNRKCSGIRLQLRNYIFDNDALLVVCLAIYRSQQGVNGWTFEKTGVSSTSFLATEEGLPLGLRLGGVGVFLSCFARGTLLRELTRCDESWHGVLWRSQQRHEDWPPLMTKEGLTLAVIGWCRWGLERRSVGRYDLRGWITTRHHHTRGLLSGGRDTEDGETPW